MPKNQQSDVRGAAKAERQRDRQAKREAKLAKRRELRDQRAENEYRQKSIKVRQK
ncbi:MAG: hypothetical protein JOZ58_25785 [Acetobacteraceae bacterium]|nr:hypothetical protein [Acetobacteraceae bacterium]